MKRHFICEQCYKDEKKDRIPSYDTLEECRKHNIKTGHSAIMVIENNTHKSTILI
ncbi:unnamed protein product [marine sediment metagenome]|uniref:Uncharacterized protein n=1 Tax=marine sediment metagenome TaxID=412755 RepID=X0XH09_9ZZZZ